MLCLDKAESQKKGMWLVLDELFHPTVADNCETHSCCLVLSKEKVCCLLLDMGNPSKVTQEYFDKFEGKYTMGKHTTKALEAGYCVCINDNVNKQNFAVFDDTLKSMGRGSLNRATSQGDVQYNKDFHRHACLLVSGRKSKKSSPAE